MKKLIVYLTGTRADFGKQKSLIKITNESDSFEVRVWVTGMHLNARYGETVNEVYRCGLASKNVFRFINHFDHDPMDRILSKTIEGFSNFVEAVKPDLIVVHGDRVEALAGAIVGSLNNILVAHIEGGEISGTVDEIIRHAVSKMSHIHFVANKEAKLRLLQMGENETAVFVIGSPDLDIIESNNLPSIEVVKNNYDIDFDEYAILAFHPVTTEYSDIDYQAKNLISAAIESGDNFVVIYPNNDSGCEFIFNAYKRIENNNRFSIFPSLRFEYFLTLLKNTKYIIGNSSGSIREAPYYGVPSINIGSRQNKRALGDQIIECNYDKESILVAIKQATTTKISPEKKFGFGNSDQLYFDLLCSDSFWKIDRQKYFRDII